MSQTMSTHDIEDVLAVLNTVLAQIDLRFQPLEAQAERTEHGLAYISNQLATILRRLDAIETAQASMTRHQQAQAAHAAMNQPYRARVRRLVTTAT